MSLFILTPIRCSIVLLISALFVSGCSSSGESTLSGYDWQQQAYLKASNTEEDDRFSTSLSLSADGQTLAVGAIGEDSAAYGFNGNQNDNSQSSRGAVYLY